MTSDFRAKVIEMDEEGNASKKTAHASPKCIEVGHMPNHESVPLLKATSSFHWVQFEEMVFVVSVLRHDEEEVEPFRFQVG